MFTDDSIILFSLWVFITLNHQIHHHHFDVFAPRRNSYLFHLVKLLDDSTLFSVGFLLDWRSYLFWTKSNFFIKYNQGYRFHRIQPVLNVYFHSSRGRILLSNDLLFRFTETLSSEIFWKITRWNVDVSSKQYCNHISFTAHLNSDKVIHNSSISPLSEILTKKQSSEILLALYYRIAGSISTNILGDFSETNLIEEVTFFWSWKTDDKFSVSSSKILIISPFIISSCPVLTTFFSY